MLLKRLSEAIGVSGQEWEIRDQLRSEIRDYRARIFTDSIGNLFCVKGEEFKGLKVMLAAHMDEIGMMVIEIEKSGFLRIAEIGSVDNRVLVSKSVVVGRSKIPGVIGAKPIHLQEKGERDIPIKTENLFVDIGAKDREDAERVVSPGDFVAFDTKFEIIEGNKAKGKAFDDRSGCAVLVKILEDDYRFPLYGVFTVQEEVGLRGSKVASYSVNPDIGIVLEGTTASDVAGIKEHRYSTTLGMGPAITFMDAAAISDRRLLIRIREVAEREGIPYQYKRTVTGGTDAGPINRNMEGVPTCVISVPCRYIHSPASILDLRDYENTIRLVKELLRSIELGGLPV